ncbi:hypothetical protein [Ornithobacterium rhinotracheale]
MMKKKMYKLGALMLLAMSVSVTAQKKPTGRVGINAPEPKATLDVQMSEDNKDATTNEGIMAPQLSKSRVAKITAPVEGTLVYVVDDANKGGLIASYSGSDPKVAKIDAKGYYYFDGTEWVKSVGKGGGANDDIWQKQPNGDVKLVAPEFKKLRNVLYTAKGAYNSVPALKDREITMIAPNNGISTIPLDLSQSNYSNTSVFNLGYADKVPTVFKDPKIKEKNFNTNILLVDENEQDPHYNSFNNVYNLLNVNEKSTKNYQGLYAGVNRVEHFGAGKVDYMLGAFNGVFLRNKGEAANLIGSYNQASSYATKHLPYMEGTRSYLTPRGTGTINQASATLNLVSLSGSANKIAALVANKSQVTGGTNFTGSIELLAGATYYFDIPKGSVKQHYGVKITDINRGSERNYAIYADSGKIRFGDSVGIGVDVPEEKLEVAGNVKAESFLGANGAGIFPDYVFEDYYQGNSSIKADYKFKSLSQVEDYVKQNGHLPGYASAKQIQKQGYVDLMATQLTNVEKIEELYLHSIEQDKALKAKDAKIQELEARLAKLEALLSK